MQLSREWLRRYWSGSCDGHIIDEEPPPKLREWDSVVNYTALLECYSQESDRIQNRRSPLSVLLAWWRGNSVE
jgi:hypothetical protein